VNGTERVYKRGFTMSEYTPWLKHLFAKDSAFHTKVIGNIMSDYLNDPDVREALNIQAQVGKWEACNNYINENWKYQNEGSFWIYPIMKANGYKIRFYSGDTDGAVPTWGTF
jgi:hypothetical protein